MNSNFRFCSDDYGPDYIKRNPCVTTLDTTPLMSEHEVNTDRVLHRNQGMRHFEGGWPENVDSTEADQVDRFLKKTNKVRFTCVRMLAPCNAV
jgi:dynein intermediate chain 2, axonemal